ncbi:phosphatase PAP2 family protein [Profundibacter amoris]|uniref:PAP2 family protein n=1 Tax=Profundibacter amoris TaxID=2171755 RepID=A0A347UDT0_9RHOB|nr:phosphatase PAP2 family protein [Profundibacter amoris]AXX97008.1 PAP2 family protein [Profundibacter amoris]
MDQPPIRINRVRHLVVYVVLLFVVVLGLENTGLDIAIQHFFYRNGAWLVDSAQPVIRFLFYDAPKKLLVLYAILILLALVLSFVLKPMRRFRTRNNLFILLCLLLVPAVVGLGKKETHVHCPYQLQEFGGEVPYVTLFEANKYEAPGRCFPAGHASGGFALLLFVLIAATRRQQMAALSGAMALGWAMGGYQMVNGRHFLSHTLTTILLAWIVILLVHLALFGRRYYSVST